MNSVSAFDVSYFFELIGEVCLQRIFSILCDQKLYKDVYTPVEIQ